MANHTMYVHLVFIPDQTLVSDGLQQLNRIAIDIENQVLYWTQGTAQKVTNIT